MLLFSALLIEEEFRIGEKCTHFYSVKNHLDIIILLYDCHTGTFWAFLRNKCI